MASLKVYEETQPFISVSDCGRDFLYGLHQCRERPDHQQRRFRGWAARRFTSRSLDRHGQLLPLDRPEQSARWVAIRLFWRFRERQHSPGERLRFDRADYFHPLKRIAHAELLA